MPRENKEPVICKECRFNINGYCKRNPPTCKGVINGKIMDQYTLWPKVGTGTYDGSFGFVDSDKIMGCFAGEKKNAEK